MLPVSRASCANRLPVYLYCLEGEYIDAGGPEGSAGYFDGEKLVAITDDREGIDEWHTIQHEGFHQFAKAVIGGELPTWVNEGLAEYFGEAVFTGDSYVTGLAPPEPHVQRVREMLKTDQYVSITKMMAMSHGEWNAALAAANYDQAWSMVYFLAHGDNGKYQPAFSKFIQLLSRGQLPDRAWETTFGNPAGFEDRWKEYWMKLPQNATEDGYNRARVSTVTSFLARATAAKQTFASFTEFAKAAEKRDVHAPQDDWLPQDLLRHVLNDSVGAGDWSLESSAAHQPWVTLTTPAGTQFRGTFSLMKGRVQRVDVAVSAAGRPSGATTPVPAHPPPR